MKLIDKADIEKILSNLWKEDDGRHSEHRIDYNKALQEIQCELDTLEAKEVDLEKECSKYFEDNNDLCVHDEYIKFAKYFFKLGLETQKVDY